MGYSLRLSIHFEGDFGNVFYAGQLVTGYVQLQTSERIKIRGIRLHVSGKAKTSWTEEHYGVDAANHGTSESKSFSGSEEYLNIEMHLFGTQKKDSVTYIEPSVHKYPFSFILPPELPPSFEDKIGHIRYKAKAKVDRPMTINDDVEVRLTVLRPLDLNREPPHLREPLVLREQAQATGYCVNGFTEINATVNRGCFVLGETISFDGEIVNRTNTTISYSKIALVQTIEYCATNRKGRVHQTKFAWTTLAKLERPLLASGHTDIWSKISLVVPQNSSLRLDGCHIINIRHTIEVSAVFDGCCGKSFISCPIVIGNAPLQDNYQLSVVTSQPLSSPATCNMAAGYIPPAEVPHIGFDIPGFQTPNYDGNYLPEVHRM